ncbi:PAS domain-containing protein [Sulfitobacter albidus]|uniref:PAS domain-containing protein n=1 Tax=Sulfitobacter albidus TaxID=2829501 RepID=A0A975JFH9_9RHOB|nr:PAS domain-containing protein [Sulfitobacter albidus]QUJ77572.1 PAS domain-containing protein [Sulfitobacter albidus]
MTKDTNGAPAQMSHTGAVAAMTNTSHAFVLTNPSLEDNPIIYVNRAFEEMTGYSSEMAIGRNCRFLQGDDTDQPAIETLRAAIKNRETCTVVLRNYRADGTLFYNRLLFTPLNEDADVNPYMLGVQSTVENDEPASETVPDQLAEIQHRVKNHLSMIIGMIRLQARDNTATAGKEFETLARRVETLQLLYEEINAVHERAGSNSDRVNLGAYLTRVANAIAYIDGRSGVRVNIDADETETAMETATQLGLIVSEIMTNAMQHAFVGRESGLVEVRIKRMSNDVLRVQIADDGIGMAEGVEWPQGGSLGGRIVRQLVSGLRAELSLERGLQGTLISIDVPRQTKLSDR